MGPLLSSWTDGSAKTATVQFVERASDENGADYVPPDERVAVFDNDGTLWCEKPLQIQLDFTIRRFAEQADGDPSLRERHPWKAAYQHDLKWLAGPVVKHYRGDDTDLELLKDAVERAFDMYRIPPERVIGSSLGISHREQGTSNDLLYKGAIEFFDDGPTKPVRISSRVGRRPILVAGNSNGDLPMLNYTGRRSRPGLRLVVRHHDPEREFDYDACAEQLLDRAHAEQWTVISMKDDGATIFGDPGTS